MEDSFGRRSVLAALLFATPFVWAQGQDSTVAERDLMILAEFLPGVYDNANQAYFDVRRNLPEARRHARRQIRIEPVENERFAGNTFLVVDGVEGDDPARSAVIALTADDEVEAVRMRRYALGGDSAREASALDPDAVPHDAACDLLWRREAGSFRGTSAGNCPAQDAGDGAVAQEDWLLSADELWVRRQAVDTEGHVISRAADNDHYQLERARTFECTANVPGVGGGRDIPSRRYGPFQTHDLGGTARFQTEGEEVRDLTITLRRVAWPINNLAGRFTRDSMVVYLTETTSEEEAKSHGYTFTEPDAQRLGLNLHWILVYCYRESNASARPTF